MRMSHLIGLSLFALAASAAAQTPQTKTAENPRITFETSKGKIVVELFADKAPKTVANILAYVDSGHYNGTIFHRVIAGFMAQGGGFSEDMSQKPAARKVDNEADNGLSNERGTIAMARTMDPHSASAQFFINLVNNANLDHTSKTPQGWGYCVFGKVVAGMDVVDAMASVPTGQRGAFADVPTSPIVITKASRS